jgi:hypothetical protein
MPGVHYRIRLPGGQTRVGVADKHGAVVLRGVKAPLKVKIAWGNSPGSFYYEGEYSILAASHGDTPEEQHQSAFDALGNLGFGGSSLADRVRAFQQQHGHLAKPALAVDGELDPRTWELLWQLIEPACD